MANAFNLTAQLQLQAPKNTSQIANQISRQLNGIKANVDLKANPRQIASANKQMQGLSKATQQSANNMGNLNRSLSEAARRFSVITIATGSMLALARSIKNAFGDAIEFERELIKIEQVTGKSVKQLSALTKEITRLSTSLGASSKDLLGISRILTQAGFEINKVKSALDILAKTTLGATFEDIQDTTEGAVAVLRQFGDEARKTGGDIKFLEQTMDAINSVSKNFAVESGDLITVIRRVGGVFESAGGSVNELIALFTSVRATTRETAETIATGLRTIFTRIQRTDTVDQLKGLGIELRNSKGEFVGAYEAINRLSAGLSSLDPRDFRFSEIVESLGGFRQIGKVIPLIKQFTVAQDALRVAQNSGGSVAKDAATAQQSLSVQFERTKEKFEALVRNLADSSSFQTLARGVLKLADAFIKMVDALEPLLPLLLPLVGLKLGKALAPGLGALSGASRFATRNQGGPIRKFHNGGLVPGVGNGDSVRAMLEPGEFVIRKDSTQKIGPENLQKLNSGGKVGDFPSSFAKKNTYRGKVRLKKEAVPFEEGVNAFNARDVINADIRRNQKQNVTQNIKKAAENMGQTQIGLARKFNSLRNNASKQGNLFEDILVGSGTLSQSGGNYGANKPLDGLVGGNRLAEVKRSKVSENQLLDKRLRHEFNKNKLKNVKLSSGRDDIKLTGVTELTPDRTSYTKKELETEFSRSIGQVKSIGQKKALGGFIQKFAAGGAVQSILKQNKVGAANLDEGKDNDVKLGVNLARINATDPVKNNNFLKNFAGVSKYIASQGVSKTPKYTLKRKSLEKSTGDRFRANIVSEVTNAADLAAGKVGKDLIGTPVKASEEAKKVLSQKLVKEGGVIGSVFEDVLNIVANRGDFSPTSQFQPFDFPNGLTGPLSDNFKGLPSSFVDARKRQTSKDKATFETKIANQIALEAAASPFGKANIPAKGSKKAQQAALGGMIKRFNEGGSNEDTVPALLTPGEFVFNKDAASRIGPEKLNQMNKQGVVGFNKGGAVGRIQRFGGAGPVTSKPSDPVLVDWDDIGSTIEKEFKLSEAKKAEVQIKIEAGGKYADPSGKNQPARIPDDPEPYKGFQAEYEARAAETPNSREFGPARFQGEALQEMLPSLNARAGASKEGDEADKLFVEARKKQTNGVMESVSDMSLGSKINAELHKEKKEEIEQYKNSNPDSPDSPNGPEKPSAGEGKEGKGLAESIQSIAQSAQNFVFLAGSASALGVQFLGLNEATAKATTATIGMVAGVLGFVGTLADMVATTVLSISSSVLVTAAKQAEAAASGQVVVAKNAEILSSNKFGGLFPKVGGKIGKFAGKFGKVLSSGARLAIGPFAALTAAISAVAIVMTFFSQKAKAEAEELSKANDEYIKKITEGEDFKAALQTGVAKTVAKAEEAQAYSLTGSSSLTGAAAGIGASVASMAATFAVVGSFGGPLGLALGGLVGAAVGIGVAMYSASEAVSAAAKKRQDEIKILTDVVGSYADLLLAQNEFKTALSDIDLAEGLTSDQRVERRLEAQERFKAASRQDDGSSKAQGILIRLAESQGKSISDLSEDDFKKNSKEGEEFKFATKQISESIKAASLNASEARKTLGEAAAGAIGGGNQTFQGLTTGTGDFARAYQSVKDAVQQEFALKRASNQIELRSIQIKLKENLAGGEREKYLQKQQAVEKQIADSRQRESQQLADLDTGIQNQIKSSNEAAEAQRQMAAAAEEAAQRMSSIIDFGNDLANLGQTIGGFEKNVSNISSLSSGGIQNFSFDEILGLKDLKRTGNAKEFSRDLNSLIKDLPDDMKQQGRAMVESVKTTAFLLQEGQVAVSRIQFKPTEGKIGVKETRDLIKAAGLDPDAIPKNMFSQIQKGLQESFQDGIDSKEFAKIFEPFIEEGNAAAKELEKINSLRNRELSAYENYVKAILDIRDKEVEQRSQAFEVSKQADELRRRVRGIDQTPGSIARDRLIESRNRLSGTGARAGDIDSIVETRRRAASLLRQSTQRSQSGNLTIDQAKQEQRNQQELQKIIKITTDELGHFSEATKDIIESEIELAETQKERLKAEKELKRGLIEDFVVGGSEQRLNIARTLFNVEKAFRTGTLQNQSAEDRSSVVSILERFGENIIPGAGMTGNELKNQLIQSDAIRFGLNPQLAKALFSQEDVQKSLVSSTDRLTNVMDKVADAMLETNAINKSILEPQFRSSGGVIYRNEGGSIFQPKGTDTVPAMLTPGEFVVRKSAVDKIGVGALNSINQGKPLYRAEGGYIGLNASYTPDFMKGVEEDERGVNASKTEPIFGYWPWEKDFYRKHNDHRGTTRVLHGVDSEKLGSTTGIKTAKREWDASKGSTNIKRLRFMQNKFRQFMPFIKAHNDYFELLKASAAFSRSVASGNVKVDDEMLQQISMEEFGEPFKNLKSTEKKNRVGNGIFYAPPKKMMTDREYVIDMARQAVLEIEKRNIESSNFSPELNDAQTKLALESGRNLVKAYRQKPLRETQTQFQKEASEKAMQEASKKKLDLPPSTPETPPKVNKGNDKKAAPQVNKGNDKSGVNQSGELDFSEKYDGTTKKVNGRNIVKGTAGLGGMRSDYEVKTTQNIDNALVEQKELKELKELKEQHEEKALKQNTKKIRKLAADAQKLIYLDEVGNKRTVQALHVQDQERAANEGRLGFKVWNEEGEYFHVPKYIPAHKVLEFKGDTDFGKKTEADAHNRVASNDALKNFTKSDVRLAGQTGRAQYLKSYQDKNGNWWTEWQTYANDKNEISNKSYKQMIKPDGSNYDAATRKFIYDSYKKKKGYVPVSLSRALSGGTEFKGEPGSGEDDYGRYKPEKDGGLTRYGDQSKTDDRMKNLRDLINEREREREEDRKQREDNNFKPNSSRTVKRNGYDRFKSWKNKYRGLLDRMIQNASRKRLDTSRFEDTTYPLGPGSNGYISFGENDYPQYSWNYKRAKGTNNVEGWFSNFKLPDGKTIEDSRGNFPDDNTSEVTKSQFNMGVHDWIMNRVSRWDGPYSYGGTNFANHPGGGSKGKTKYFNNLRKSDQIGLFWNWDKGHHWKNPNMFYLNSGGGVGLNGGMDSVPAMLTPGEFVMSREAVAKHGVGYMKNLNMGKVTGFRRGGVVGTGNVQYRSNGSNGAESSSGGMGIMIDSSTLSATLNTFVADFSTQMSKILQPMQTIANQLQGIANSFSNLTMFHTFGGELSMSVNISNKDAIIAAVSDGLLPMIADQIQRQIDASANSFKAGG